MRTLGLFLAVLLSVPTIAQDATWTFTGGPGIAEPTVLDLDDEGNVYVWSRYGLFMSDDGTTWTPYPQPYLYASDSYPVRFALLPNGDYFLGRSMVVGTTACNGPDDDKLDGYAIHVSVDGDEAVTTAYVGGRDYRFLDLTATPDGRAWAIFGYNCGSQVYGTYLSHYDPGTDVWTSLAATGVEGEVFDLEWTGTDAPLLLAGMADGIYASADGTTLTPLGLSDEAVYAVARTPEGTLLAGTDDGLHRSTDDGATWLPVASLSTRVNDLHADAGLILATTQDGIFRSSDDGESWAPSALDAVAHSVTGTDGSYAATAEGATVYRSDDGETWMPDIFYDGDISVLTLAPDGLLATDMDRGYYRFADGAWEHLPYSFNMTAPAIATAPDGTYYAAAFNYWYSEPPYTYTGTLHRSDDAGASWQSIRTLSASAVDLEITHSGTVVLYTYISFDSQIRILRSTDGGSNWDTTLKASGPGGQLYQGPSGTLYLFSPDWNRMYVSQDDGLTWDPHDHSEFSGFVALHESDDLLIASTPEGVLRSEDAGTTWNSTDLDAAATAFASNSAGYLFAAVASGAECGGAPSNGAVCRSTDAGLTWSPYGLEGVPAQSLAVDDDGILFAGTKRGVFQTSETTVDAEDEAGPQSFAVAPPYPNPFARSTSIAFTLDQPGPVTVTVYDALGRTVARLHDGPLDAGEHAVSWTPEGHASGVYLVRIAEAEHERTVPLTLLR